MDVVYEDLCVALAVLVLVAEGQTQQLRGVTRGALQLYLLEIKSLMEIYFVISTLYFGPSLQGFYLVRNLLFDRDIRDIYI